MEPTAPREAILPTEYAQATMRLFFRVRDGLLTKDGVIGDIRRKPTRHHGRARIVVLGADHDTEREGITVEVEIPREDVRPGRAKGLTDAWVRYAEIQAREMRAMLYRNLGSMTSASGMSMDSGGDPTSPETLLLAFDRMEVAFDEDGEPRPKKFIGSPGVWEAIMSQWTREHDERYKRIMEAKRAAWEASRRTRRLAARAPEPRSSPSSTPAPT